MQFSKTNELWPYPKMKDSGVKWLGKVPSHWEVLPNRTLFEEVKERDHPEEPMLSVTIKRGVILQNQLLEDSTKKDGSNLDKSAYKLVRPGYIAYNKMRAWQGAFGASDYQGIVSPAYIVQRPRDGVDSDFVHFLFRTPGFAKETERWSYGITSDMWSLRPEHFKMIYTCVPPLAEQTAIVRFLDHADRRIQRYIRAKQRLISLLEEQKQAIIHQAVTGQIDVRTGKPYPAYKPSGVKWLGQVPEDWQLHRLKDVAQVQTGLTLGKDYSSTRTISRPYLRVANVQAGCLDLTNIKSISVPLNEANRSTVLTGDVLMTEGGDIDKLGRGCVWRDEIPGCLHQNHIFAVRCKRGLLSPEFLVGLMGSIHGRTYFELTAKQTTNLASTNSSTLRRFPVFLPVLEVQAAILDVISEKTNSLDYAIGRLKREIDLIQEYRTRLIADVVTGKLDVREAAAELPELDTLPKDDYTDAEESAEEYAAEDEMTV